MPACVPAPPPFLAPLALLLRLMVPTAGTWGLGRRVGVHLWC